MKPLLALAAVVSVACGACVPFVQHGPWVRSGTSGGFIVAGSGLKGFGDAIDSDGGSNDKSVNVGIDFAARGGYVPVDSSKTAFSAGVTLPLWTVLLAGGLDSPADALQFVSADAYFNGPRTSTHTTALGATISSHHYMPYFQFGSRTPSSKSWYTTQAFLILPESDLFIWLPSITSVNQEARPRATHLNFGAGIGRSRHHSVYMVSVGVTMEFFRKDSRVR